MNIFFFSKRADWKGSAPARHGLCTIVAGVCLALGGALYASAGWAETAPEIPAKGDHSARVILLGTEGGPTVSRLRSEPASLLVVDGHPYLIDAGAGVSRQLFLAGWLYPPGTVNRIFITHHHLDHNAGLVSLMSLTWAAAAFSNHIVSDVDIYGPPATSFLVQTALQYLSVSERIFRAGINELMPAAPMFHGHDILHGGFVYSDDYVRVTAVENTHFQSKSDSATSGEDKSYSYRFDTAAGSVVFTGDTGPSEAVTKLATGADVLVTEVRTPAIKPPRRSVADMRRKLPPELIEEERLHMEQEHLTPEQIGKMATKAGVKVIILTHFVPANDKLTDMTPYTAGVQEYFGGAVIPGKDLFEYDLSKTSVAKTPK